LSLLSTKFSVRSREVGNAIANLEKVDWRDATILKVGALREITCAIE
jgi:hypothetical protein